MLTNEQAIELLKKHNCRCCHKDCNACEISVAIEALGGQAKLKAENKVLRNELCLKCGKYHEAHNGACTGCRWLTKEGANERTD